MKSALNRGIGLVILLLVFTQAMSQNATMYKYVRIDTTKVITEAQMVKIATRFYDRHYKMVYAGSEKKFVDESFHKLEADGADRYKIAQGLSSTAVCLTGTGQAFNISLAFSAKAVILFPKDTLIVNNFGAILRMMDSVKTSLPVLLYAKSLYPSAPVILTNLGNTLFELYDDRSAEVFYKRALKVNPDFALARQGLVNVYLKRKEIKNALEELYKGAKGIYCQSMKKVHDNLKYQKSYQPPGEPCGNKPGNDQAAGDGSGTPNWNVPVENLHLPPFPEWPDVSALINDNSIKNLIKVLQDGRDESQEKSIGDFAALADMTPEQQAAWARSFTKKETTPGLIRFDNTAFGMELLKAYFEDQINKENRRYIQSDSLSNAKFSKSLKQIEYANDAKMKTLGGDVEKIQAFMIERCKEITNLVDDNYKEWRDNAALRQNRYNDLLITYWVYCEQYLNRTYDLNEFEKLNNTRKAFVYFNYYNLYFEYQARQLIFATLNMTAFASISGDCPSMPPPPPEAETKDNEVNVPDKKAPDCPFEGKKLKVGLIVCSFGLDCKSIEGECGEGLLAGAKWNYKRKEITGFFGAGIKADLGVEGAVNVKAEGKTGFEITYNTKSQAGDIGFKSEATITAGVGKMEVGQAFESKVTAATGIDVDRTTELTYNPLGFDK
ncbi:MAG TPA: hypothetical protein PK796_03800 [Bacteroidales bacterium]|jgi:hypothetical protein|nr:hypothetical protein [Bacteroidales bacterium]